MNAASSRVWTGCAITMHNIVRQNLATIFLASWIRLLLESGVFQGSPPLLPVIAIEDTTDYQLAEKMCSTPEGLQ